MPYAHVRSRHLPLHALTTYSSSVRCARSSLQIGPWPQSQRRSSIFVISDQLLPMSNLKNQCRISVLWVLVIACLIFSATALSVEERDLLGLVQSAVERSKRQQAYTVVSDETVVVEQFSAYGRSKATTTSRSELNFVRNGDGEYDLSLRSDSDTVSSFIGASTDAVSSQEEESIVELAVNSGTWEKRDNEEAWVPLAESNAAESANLIEYQREVLDVFESAELQEKFVLKVSETPSAYADELDTKCVIVTLHPLVKEFSKRVESSNKQDKEVEELVERAGREVLDRSSLWREYCIGEQDNLVKRMRSVLKNNEIDTASLGVEASASIRIETTAVVIDDMMKQDSAGFVPGWSLIASIFCFLAMVFA